jgi:hypothetical protein
MRQLWLAAGVIGCLALAACEQSKSDATEQAPAPKRSLARPASMYAGQEDLVSVDTASVAVGKGGLELTADGKAASAGYTHTGFLPRIYIAPPPDGIYEVDVVADRPAAPAAQAATPITVKGEWAPYPESRLKGVKFIAKNNAVTAMLPPPKG